MSQNGNNVRIHAPPAHANFAPSAAPQNPATSQHMLQKSLSVSCFGNAPYGTMYSPHHPRLSGPGTPHHKWGQPLVLVTPTTNDTESKASASEHQPISSSSEQYEHLEASNHSTSQMGGAPARDDEKFTVDSSCLGERSIDGEITGFLREGASSFVKLGYNTNALLISARGFGNREHYWEFQDMIESDGDIETSYRVGVVPRSLQKPVDINNTIEHNGGFSVWVDHGPKEDQMKYGDRMGVYLICIDDEATMHFFKNGKFCGIFSLRAIPVDKPLYPAICVKGHHSARSAINITSSPRVPCLSEHQEKESEFVKTRQQLSIKKCFTRPMYPMAQQKKIASSHLGGTVEISSQLTEELKLRAGDAILFVDQHDDDDSEWQFETVEDNVLAQDFFYHHQEYDVHSSATANTLKVAFKFVALAPGVAILKSAYTPTQQVPKWTQKLKVVVVE